MIHTQRIIFETASGLTDRSIELSDFKSDSITLPTGLQKIYIGTDLPFNHKYFLVDVKNTDADLNLAVKIWNGTEFKPAISFLDMTALLTKDGILQFTVDRDEMWSYEQDSTEIHDDLEGYYDLYWCTIELGTDESFSEGTKIKYIGHKFSTDLDLFSLYPDLNNSTLMTSFKAEKADWADQTFIAAETIIRDLKKKNVIKSRNQVFDWHLFNFASIHKTAEIIYHGLGKAYDENRKLAVSYYNQGMDLKMFGVDKNADGTLTKAEKFHSTKWITR